MSYRTCKRCSVTRVNTLCDLFERAFKEQDKKAERDLTNFVKLAADRGYREGLDLLDGGPDKTSVRSMCWNVSSLLTDEDMVRFGYSKNGRR